MRVSWFAQIIGASVLAGFPLIPTHVAAAAEAPAGGPGPYQVTKTIHLGGQGRWDYALADPANKVVYVTRQTHVQVVRTEDGKVVADLTGMKGNHGVALVHDQSRGFVSDGQANAVVVFDTKTFKEIGKVPTGQNPDAIIYDPSSQKVIAFDGKGKDVTVIDPAAAPGTGAVVGHIPLDGKPEFAAADGEGHVYLNLEDKNAIVQIDAATMKVQATWPIEGGESPSGLAIDPANHHLFVGCDNHVMAIVDTQSGKTLGTVPIGEGVDACGFDPGTGEAFASCGDGTLTIAKASADGKFEVEQTLKTKQGARTMALDASTHTIYLPTAEFPAGPAGGERRPRAKPDSFMIVVVARQQK